MSRIPDYTIDAAHLVKLVEDDLALGARANAICSVSRMIVIAYTEGFRSGLLEAGELQRAASKHIAPSTDSFAERRRPDVMGATGALSKESLQIISERASNSAGTYFSDKQREWCLNELARCGWERAVYAEHSDRDVARGVLEAWAETEKREG